MVRGAVRPRPVTPNPIWVRIQSVYDGTAYEARVDENGGFRVEELLRGNYVVLVIEGGKVLYCGTVTFRVATAKPGTLTIDVSNPVPTVGFVQ